MRRSKLRRIRRARAISRARRRRTIGRRRRLVRGGFVY